MNHTGRKILYGLGMFLSVVVLLASAAGIVGIWVLEPRAANSAVAVLGVLENGAGSMRQAAQGIDQKLTQVQAISTQVSDASAKLSQNVTDQGLVKLLLPDQQEQTLTATTASVKDAFSGLRDKLADAVAIYKSIDQLPFVKLPGPSQKQVDQFTASIADVQATVDQLKSDITAFRAGASDRISKVTAGVDQLSSRLAQGRDQLATLDARLAAAQAALGQLKNNVANTLMLAALLATLMLAWVAYSQVELIRLFTQRWKGLGKESSSEEHPDQPVGDASEQANESGLPPAPENPA